MSSTVALGRGSTQAPSFTGFRAERGFRTAGEPRHREAQTYICRPFLIHNGPDYFLTFWEAFWEEADENTDG